MSIRGSGGIDCHVTNLPQLIFRNHTRAQAPSVAFLLFQYRSTAFCAVSFWYRFSPRYLLKTANSVLSMMYEVGLDLIRVQTRSSSRRRVPSVPASRRSDSFRCALSTAASTSLLLCRDICKDVEFDSRLSGFRMEDWRCKMQCDVCDGLVRLVLRAVSHVVGCSVSSRQRMIVSTFEA